MLYYIYIDRYVSFEQMLYYIIFMLIDMLLFNKCHIIFILVDMLVYNKCYIIFILIDMLLLTSVMPYLY